MIPLIQNLSNISSARPWRAQLRDPETGATLYLPQMPGAAAAVYSLAVALRLRGRDLRDLRFEDYLTPAEMEEVEKSTAAVVGGTCSAVSAYRP